MEYLIPELLWQLLLIAGTLSVLIMAALQRIKQLPLIKSDYQIWIANLLLAFGIGIPFYLTFYGDFPTLDTLTFAAFVPALWVSFLAFLGAPAIYAALKEQTIINYTPKSLKQLQGVSDEDHKQLVDALHESMGILGNEK